MASRTILRLYSSVNRRRVAFATSVPRPRRQWRSMRLVRPTRAEWALLVLALALRLWLVSHATWFPVSDTRDYHDLAGSLVSGRGYLQVYEGERAEYRGLTFYAYRMPGYPAFLAVLYRIFGWDPMVGFVANVACELATQVLVLVLGRWLLDPAASLVAQALFATHVVWTASLMTESLFTLLFTALVLMVVVLQTTTGPGGAARLGLLVTVALFVRPIAMAVLPAACFRTLRARPGRRGVTLALLILAPVALGLAAWTVRNQQRLGTTVILTTNLGAHNARSFGIDRAGIVREARGRGLNEAEINDALLAEIRRAVTRSPAWATVAYVRRCLDLFSLKRPWEVRTLLARRTFAAPRGSAWAQRAYGALFFQYYLTYPLALAGALLLARQRRPLGGVWTILASFVLTHAVVSDGNFRLAAPLYPLLCLFAGHGIARLDAWVRRCHSQSGDRSTGRRSRAAAHPPAV